ncbi:MAG TPA: sialidase family protein [Chitinophagaceae bacterium]|nr:sialidase family protein [Chitinophagaceae bacterium]
MKSLLLISLPGLILLTDCHNQQPNSSGTIIATGQMPNVVTDHSHNIQLVYGSGDSILYSYSLDQGRTFSTPALISIVQKLAASHMRGPQIAATKNGLSVTACNEVGDIFSFVKDQSGRWSQTARINDSDTTAKENLMALAADGDNVFAAWLDLRDKHNKIFGAKSIDGGQTWSKNIMVYASPDTTVCECCKPSVAVKGNTITVMFRNWLSGNRDLYLVQSLDGGVSFGQAQKLGTESWALNGCPMDGGAVVIDKNGNPQTVWNRKGTVYSCEPGREETALGKGRSCTMKSVNGKNVYAWVENGNVVILKPHGAKEDLGLGQLPVITAIDDEQILCVWENNKQINKAIVKL